MRSLVAPFLVILFAATAAHAQVPDRNATGNGFIGVYADPEGTRPCGPMPPGSTVTLYVIATLAGATADGVLGAEFRPQVDIFGHLWVFTPDQNVSRVVGHPFDGVGVTLFFRSCQTGDGNGHVRLGTIDVLSGAYSAPETAIHIEGRNPSSVPHLHCPLLFLCDGIAPTCVSGRSSTFGTPSCPSCQTPAAPCEDTFGDGFIGVFADAEATQPCVDVPVGTRRTLHVVAILDGTSTAGIDGAEFRFEFSDVAGYAVQWIPDPELATATGDPLDLTECDTADLRGAVVTFRSCARGAPGQRVHIGKLEIASTGGSQPIEIRVKGAWTGNVADQCPSFVTCGAARLCLTPRHLTLGREPIASRTTVNALACQSCPIAPAEPPPPPPAVSCNDRVSNGVIAVLAGDPGSEPCMTLPVGATFSAPVVAILEGASAAGITGAEFRLEMTHPAGYLFSWNPNPLAGLSLGNPIDDTPGDPSDARGVNIAFADCQTGSGGRVFLGTLALMQSEADRSTEILAKRRTPPTNPSLACPLIVLCDAPVFTSICLTRMEEELGHEPIAFISSINRDPCTRCPLPSDMIGVQPTSWSRVKSLYR